MKVWDKYLQGVAYTYITHEPLTCMQKVGENSEFLVCGLGRGNFIVYGLKFKNQLDIVELAHAEQIIQIVSLGKLKDKYFATRCIDGHVNIWSAINHPDRLFSLYNIDADEEKLAHLQPPPEKPEPIVEKKKKKRSDDTDAGSEEEEDEEEELAEEEDEPQKKGKPEPVRPVAPVLIGRPEPSDKDFMIELKWRGLINSSSTMLCISNYNEKQVIICEMDLKTKKSIIRKTFKLTHRPTCLFQINMDYILIGNDAGQLESWSIETEAMINVLDTRQSHEAEEISSIIELKDPSYLITGDEPGSNEDRFILTTSTESEIFFIWRVKTRESNQAPLLTYHVKIQTTLTGGIKYVLQTSPS